MSQKYSWIEMTEGERLIIGVDLSLYTLEALFRVCYIFTDRCYLFLAHEEPSKIVKVHFARKDDSSDLERIAGEFSNELINQRVRQDIAAETRTIRELIVAQAFAEGNLLDQNDSEADYDNDPRGITK